jgi:hypothetical protein
MGTLKNTSKTVAVATVAKREAKKGTPYTPKPKRPALRPATVKSKHAYPEANLSGGSLILRMKNIIETGKLNFLSIQGADIFDDTNREGT